MDLFDAPDAQAVRPMPARPCNRAQHAKELLGLPTDWRVTGWKVLGDPERPLGFEISGGVHRHAMARGPRKGKPDWRRPEPGTDVTLTIGAAQHAAWVGRWEAETGLCGECSGTGAVFASWDRERGTRFRRCEACRGTGDRTPSAGVAAGPRIPMTGAPSPRASGRRPPRPARGGGAARPRQPQQPAACLGGQGRLAGTLPGVPD